MALTRRELLVAAGMTAAGAIVAPSGAPAQTPKRGGTLTVRMWDPPHFDFHAAGGFSYKLHTLATYTHGRLVKHRTGPAVTPGTFPLVGDLAESWTQPNDTTYVFKLRKGVKWPPKPPVNSREFTADDVVYSITRFQTTTGNTNAYLLRSVEKVEAVDRHTVKFALKEPYAWFLDILASPMVAALVAKECVDTFGDLKKPESFIGLGPWMLDSYRPNQGTTLVRNPHYHTPGLPYIDRVEIVVDEDNASRISSFLAGKYDLGWENATAISRTDWMQIKEVALRRRPGLKFMEYASNQMSHISMRTDQKPFSDVRVRHAISHAIDRQGIIDATLEGVGNFNAAVPVGLKEWALPVKELGEGARYFKYDPAEAKRLLAAAGYPNGFPGSLCFATYGSTVLVDQMQLLLKNLKDVGIDARLDQKEYGGYIASCFTGNFPSMTFGPQTPFLEPDSFLYGQYYPGEPRNQSHINDPVLGDMLVRQRRTFDLAKRREIIHEIQRYIARQQYYITTPSGVFIGVWDGAVQNFAPNLGYDWGGRLTAAWLNR
jgi:peptide/nickel transport system substrate-binding protein